MFYNINNLIIFYIIITILRDPYESMGLLLVNIIMFYTLEEHPHMDQENPLKGHKAFHKGSNERKHPSRGPKRKRRRLWQHRL